MLISRYKEAFYPFEDITLDEIVIGCTGHHRCKMSKPIKDHIKVFGLYDSVTGYVVNVFIYRGKGGLCGPEHVANSQQTIKVFDFLLQGLQTGHHIFSHHGFTSFELIKYLLNKVLLHRNPGHQYPIFSVGIENTSAMSYRQHAWFYNAAADVICVAWQDKKADKPVVCASSNAEVNMETIQTG